MLHSCFTIMFLQIIRSTRIKVTVIITTNQAYAALNPFVT